jgi:hypothetical protein
VQRQPGDSLEESWQQIFFLIQRLPDLEVRQILVFNVSGGPGNDRRLNYITQLGAAETLGGGV